MPSSHLYQIPTIIRLMCALKPASILDVGCGFGKYGFLAREYLETWHSRYQKSDWVTRIDCIEAYAPYITELHRFIYNEIYQEDALSALKKINAGQYSLVLAIDVLEHFSKGEGEMFLAECQRIGKNTLVSTPREFGEQDALFGNVYEVHRSVWNEEELTGLGAKGFAPDQFSVIALFSTS